MLACQRSCVRDRQAGRGLPRRARGARLAGQLQRARAEPRPEVELGIVGRGGARARGLHARRALRRQALARLLRRLRAADPARRRAARVRRKCAAAAVLRRSSE
jgi:hypothetical protein